MVVDKGSFSAENFDLLLNEIVIYVKWSIGTKRILLRWGRRMFPASR